MIIKKKVRAFKRKLNNKIVKHPSYIRSFKIDIKPSKKISYAKGKICPFCNATMDFIIKNGRRKTEGRGYSQRYYCYWCEKRFSLGGDMHRMKNNRKIIEKAILLRQKGYTLREIQTKLNNIVTYLTISRWIEKWKKNTK